MERVDAFGAILHTFNGVRGPEYASKQIYSPTIGTMHDFVGARVLGKSLSNHFFICY